LRQGRRFCSRWDCTGSVCRLLQLLLYIAKPGERSARSVPFRFEGAELTHPTVSPRATPCGHRASTPEPTQERHVTSFHNHTRSPARGHWQHLLSWSHRDRLTIAECASGRHESLPPRSDIGTKHWLDDHCKSNLKEIASRRACNSGAFGDAARAVGSVCSRSGDPTINAARDGHR